MVAEQPLLCVAFSAISSALLLPGFKEQSMEKYDYIYLGEMSSVCQVWCILIAFQVTLIMRIASPGAYEGHAVDISG